MKPLTTSLIALALGFCSYAYADPWGKLHLKEAEKKAVESINQFIQKDNRSQLYRWLSDKEQAELRETMQFSSPDSPSFANLRQKTPALVKIIKNLYSREKIAYASLLLNYSNSEVYNSNAIYLYKTILRYDDNGAVYAFKQLDRLNLALDSKKAEEREELRRTYGFHLTKISIEDEYENPEVCVNFSQRVRGEPAQNWQTLISVTPKPNGEWGYHGDKLCFFGKWQTRYQVTVNQALQNEYHLKLGTDKTQMTNTGIRPPMLRFTVKGSVLDAADNRYIAVDTANVDSVKVRLWQIPVNNLSNDSIQKILESPQDIGSWRLRGILTREGEKLFSGTFDVGEYPLNQTVTSNIYFDDLLDNPSAKNKAKAGIYVITVSNADENDDDDDDQLAFSLSNAGFSAYLTGEGLWAELRDLQTAQPIVGEAVTLYAKNNTILAKVTTDAKGVAHFDKPLINGKDGLQANHVISESGRYFAYANILEKPVDLSDKGLSGKIDNAPLRSWVWADRGIYRPNDTAKVMWLLKTPTGKPFNHAPVWATLLRPDGKVLQEKLVKADNSGAYQFSHYFANNTRPGDWTLRLSLGKGGALLTSQTLPVAAITPQQIEVKIKPLNTSLKANSTAHLTVQADWLYGAPAADLSANMTRSLRSSTLTQPHWQGWQVGLHDEENVDVHRNEGLQTTTKDGSTTFALKLEEMPLTTQPLHFKVTAAVTEPGGKSVTAIQKLPITRRLPYMALKADGENTVDVALVNDNGELQAGVAKWQLYRVNYDYYWYNKYDSWQYQLNETRQLITSGSVNLDGEKAQRLTLPLDDGAWVLTVRGNSPAVAASIPLEYGQYYSPSINNAPDRITLSSDKKRYADGETVTLHLHAPFDGKATVKLALNDRIIDNHLLDFKDGKATLTLTWDSRWNHGLWLLANAWNGDVSNVHSRRAIGLHWLGGDLGPYRIDLAVDTPETTLPNTTLKLPLSISPEQADTATWVQVAVIDDGLYRLAKPSFSSPLRHFFAKQQLNIRFFDVWGRMIRQMKARQAAIRSGAGGDESEDLSALKALPELDLQLVTFWSKPVQFDAEGKAVVEVNIPQFNGRLRVMAAAWNETRLGATETTVTVKAPLVATLYSPPYLSPKDSSQLRVRLHNTTDKAMTVNTALTAQGVNLLNNAKATKETLTLAPEQERWVARQFNVDNHATQRVQFDVSISGDQNSHLKNINLSRFADVRPRAYPLKSQSLSVLDAGQEAHLSVAQGRLLERNLFISTQAPFDPENMIKQLSVYPYGCTEQLTGKAASNLLLPKLMTRYKLPDATWGNADEREKYLFAIQSQLANRQSQDGGFSLWGKKGNSVWLTAFVTDFLLNAQQANQLGNNLMLARAVAYLRNAVMRDWGDDEARAYAHYALAKSGEAVQGASLRFAESLLDKETLPMLTTPTLYTAAALVSHGELALATRLMTTINAQGVDTKFYDSYAHYGAGLRNYAQSLNVLYDLQRQLNELGVSGKLKTETATAINTLWLPMRQALANHHYYSTQELYWLSALAANLPASHDKADIRVAGQSVTIEQNKHLRLDNRQTVSVKNTGNYPVYLTQSDWLIPDNDEIVENGYSIVMRYEDLQGNSLDISQLKQNQQVLAIATVTMKRHHKADVLFVYPLPAGLTSLPSAQAVEHQSDRPWTDKLVKPSFRESRDDRYLAAFNMKGKADKDTVFTHVFMLRAARKGTWHAPAYSIEEMYQPEYRAVYPSPTVTIE